MIYIIEFYDNESETWIAKEFFLNKGSAEGYAEAVLLGDEDLLGYNIFNLEQSIHD